MFEICLVFFQACGFYPVRIRKLSKYSPLTEEKSAKCQMTKIFLSLWSFVNFGIVLSLILYVSINHDQILYAITPIGEINDILVYFSLLFAHFVIIIESFINRKYFVYYWNYYQKHNRIGRPRKAQKWRVWIFVKILLFVMFSVATEILVITNVTSDQQWTNFWNAEVFSLLMTRNRHIQHIFFIDVIFFSLEDLNKHLRNTISWSKAVGADKSFSRKFLHRNVSQSKEKFKNLMEMLICVNKIFCWSQVFNIGQHFIEITSELYWVYAFAIGPAFMWRKFKWFEKF